MGLNQFNVQVRLDDRRGDSINNVNMNNNVNVNNNVNSNNNNSNSKNN